MLNNDPLIPKHGGYHNLKSFQLAQLVYDLTVRFCEQYVDRKSRTRDQMVQAARSGVQNIAEGSQASGTSRKSELKLTNVARASLEELKLDYKDYLRHRGLVEWERNDPRREELIRRRPKTLEDFVLWTKDSHRASGPSGLSGRSGHSRSTESTSSTRSTFKEIAANGAIALITAACYLLDRQLAAQAAAFEKHGGITERLYHRRDNWRNHQ